MTKIKVSDNKHYLRQEGRRIYLCWLSRVGAMGQMAENKTILGIKRRAQDNL